MSWKTRMSGVKQRPRAYDLMNPDDCRTWLKDLKFGPTKSKITKFQIGKDTFVTVDSATDIQILNIAQGLAHNLNNKKTA